MVEYSVECWEFLLVVETAVDSVEWMVEWMVGWWVQLLDKKLVAMTEARKTESLVAEMEHRKETLWDEWMVVKRVALAVA